MQFCETNLNRSVIYDVVNDSRPVPIRLPIWFTDRSGIFETPDVKFSFSMEKMSMLKFSKNLLINIQISVTNYIEIFAKRLWVKFLATFNK